MAYGDFEDLTQRTCLDKVLCHRTFDIDENSEMMNIKKILFQWFIIFFIKRERGSTVTSKNILNQQLAEEFYKPVIFFFEKKLKVYSSFNGNISGKDLTDINT